MSAAPIEEMEWEDEAQYLSKTEHDFRSEQDAIRLKIDEFGYTDLHNAISDNNSQMVKRLMESNKLAVEWQTCEGETPLYLACAKRDTPIGIVEMLLDKFPEACRITNKDEMYPLHMATFNRRFDIVKLLIEHKAPINATDLDGETALHVAVTDQCPDERIIDYLIARSDMSLANNSGHDALHCVITKKDYKNPKIRFNLIDKLLKQQKIPVDGFGWNILHHAVAANQLKIVKELLAEQPTIRNVITHYQNNALSVGCAVKHINIEIIKALLNDKTTTYVSGEFMEETPLGRAIINERLDIVKLLMQRFPTRFDADAALRLAMTVPSPDDAIVDHLVDNLDAHMQKKNIHFKVHAYADAIKRKGYKNQAIRFKILEKMFKLLPRSEIFSEYALKACSLNIPIRKVLSLVKYSQVDLAVVDKFCWNMLHHAVHENHLECVQILLKENPLLATAETCERETALFLGCANKNINIEIISLLVDCDPNAYRIMNDKFKLPLDMAVLHQREDIVEKLKEVAALPLNLDMCIDTAFLNAISNTTPNFRIIDLLLKFKNEFREKVQIILDTSATMYQNESIRLELLKKMLPLVLGTCSNKQCFKYIFIYAYHYIGCTAILFGRDCSSVCSYLLTYIKQAYDDRKLAKFMMDRMNSMHTGCCCQFPVAMNYFMIFCMHRSISRSVIEGGKFNKYYSVQLSSQFLCMMRQCFESDEQLAVSQKVATKVLNIENPPCFLLIFNYWFTSIQNDYAYERVCRIFRLLEHLLILGVDFVKIFFEIFVDIYEKLARVNGESDDRFVHLNKFICALLMPLNVGFLRIKVCDSPVVGLVHERFGVRFGYKKKIIHKALRNTSTPYEEPSSLKEICRDRIFKTATHGCTIHTCLLTYIPWISGLDIPFSLKEFLKYRYSPKEAHALFMDNSS